MSEPSQREPVTLAAVAACSAVVCVLLPPISRTASHGWRMVLSALAIGMVVAWVRGMPRLPWRAAMLALCLLGIGNYFQFERRQFAGITDFTDVTYYYLNSKYFDELGYTGLYPALIWADRERKAGRTDHIRKVRDLSNYRIRTARVAQLEGRRLRDDAFTEDRWTEFGDDSEILLDQLSPRALETNFFVDHGYNPPPPWTLVGGALSSLTPVNYVPTLTHVDTVIVVAMFGGVWWAFGFDATLVGLLFYVVTFSGRWPILGQAILRFDWLAGVVLGACLLKKDRPGAAGASLAYAATNRLFPGIFLGVMALVAIRSRWRGGELGRRWARFAVGAGLMAVLTVGGSFVRYGPSAFKDSVHNLWMHNQTYSSHRVGLGDVLVFRGETTRDQINAGGGMRAKEARIIELQRPLRLAALGAMGLVALAVVRAGREDWEALGWAAIPLFCATNAQVNYWNLRLLLVLWHFWLLRPGASRSDRRLGALGLCWLFACEMVTQATKVAEWDRYTTTTTTSLFLLCYFVGLAGWLLARSRVGRAA